MKNPKLEPEQEFPMQKLIDTMEADEELRPKEERENKGSHINVFKVEETLEEVVENWLYDLENTNPLVIEKGYPWIPMKFGFIEGSKYQQEKMYSEEDLREAFTVGQQLVQDINNDKTPLDFNKWLINFKKK